MDTTTGSEINDAVATSTTESITVTVKFGGRTIPVILSPDSTIKHLKSLIQPLTDVLPRGQKLIAKGKILVDDKTLRSLEITNGCKLMLIASQGLHQGSFKMTRDQNLEFTSKVVLTGSQPEEKAARLYQIQVICQGRFTITTTTEYFTSEVVPSGPQPKEKADFQSQVEGGPILKEAQTRPRSREIFDDSKAKVAVDKSRSDRWKLTGVIALSECNLKDIPDEVWTCGSSVRRLDASNNYIQALPSNISSLTSLKKILLNKNELLDKCISWAGLMSLRHLTCLNLSVNQLMVLPPTIGQLTSLEELRVSSNILTSIPTEIGLLTKLQILVVNNNRISIIPTSIGNCRSLIQIDLSENLIVELPETIGNLLDLKALHLNNNSLKSIPSTIFKKCTQLSTLDLHNTEITLDVLRQFEGWEEFDQRRLLKHQKQLDFRVVGSAEFDEGGDKN